MEYTVQKLAELSGVSGRTLRYYDRIGLLRPERTGANGYRLYGPREVDLLQQILFYRAQGLALAQIGTILHASDFDRVRALEGHLAALKSRKEQLERLIDTVSRTLRAQKGETEMSDREKFEGFKAELIEQNEREYGAEARARYGGAAVDASALRVKGMSEETWQRAQALHGELCALLRAAMAQGDPAGAEAQRACALHAQWLRLFWGEGAYSKAAHLGLAETYVSDARFSAYYDAEAGAGAARFLKAALEIYTA